MSFKPYLFEDRRDLMRLESCDALFVLKATARAISVFLILGLRSLSHPQKVFKRPSMAYNLPVTSRSSQVPVQQHRVRAMSCTVIANLPAWYSIRMIYSL
ncbi:hypothetical protein EVAR_32276_1 [Eumeta japonica]|uniref:Uncharacterized protein n=1 Tax=Eumeta variegata TaxID=151549 RepID=A0A4C1WEN4_EUMVA|nr:hypothetical protein EVAR_32276_1 [Eumeta japonica]